MAKDGKSTHYDAGGIEVIDVIQAKLTPDQYFGFLLGNSMKYSMRMMHKGDTPDSDAKKAAFYSAEVVEHLRCMDIAGGGVTDCEREAIKAGLFDEDLRL